MPYDVGVSQYLQGKGVSSNDIGYDQNSGNVTVRGQNFYKPELNMAGTTYSNQTNLDNAYGNYSKSLPVIQPDGSVGTTGNTGMEKAAATAAGVTPGAGQGGSKSASTGYSNPYTQMIGDLIKHLSDTSNAPAPDIYSSPQYAAAKANQDRQSADTVRHANESAAGAGLGHSTIMTDRSQRIQDDSNNYLQTQLVPQIMSQLQQQRQQELTNQQNQLHDYMTLGQQADNQHNADRTYDAGRQDAATTATGYYNPSGMTMDQINQEIAKNSNSYASATPAQRQELHDRNIELNNLLGKTFDPGTGTYSGGTGHVGQRTLAGQTLDLNNAKDMALLTGYMSDGKGGYVPTNAKQQQDLTNAWTESDKMGQVSPNLSKLTGIAIGTPTEAAKEHAANIAVSQRNAANSERSTTATIDNLKSDNTRADNAAKQNHLMEIWKATGKAPAGIEGVPVDTPYGQTPKYSTVEEFAKYVETTPLISNVGGIKTVTDPIALEKAILSSGMTPQEMTKAYNAYKIPLKK